jgi:aspartate/tyrosine/aromatic aminotransferase
MNRLKLLRSQLRASKTKADLNDIFGHLTLAPADPIIGTTAKWRADPDPSKLNLGVGAYRTEEEKPHVFNIVKQVERELLEDLLANKSNKEYLGIEGHAEFRELSKKLVFGQDCTELKRIVTVQSLSGTGALRVGAEFIRKFIPGTIHVPNPTWITHHAIFNNAGLQFKEYPYYNPKNMGFDFTGMINHLASLPQRSVILLHAAAHNPTGNLIF